MPKRERFKTARPVARLRQGDRQWYRITNLADGVAEVAIYDEVGYLGVTAADFITELKAIDARAINLHISSPGGEVYDGFAIFEALRAHRATVTTYVDSLAASIASVIAMAGDRIVMGKFAELMIHDAMGLCVGNASDMAAMIDDLNRESDRIAAVYAERAGGTPGQWRKRMQDETWYSAKEAVAAGLADEVAKPHRQGDDEDMPMAARWDLSIFAYGSRAEAPAPNMTPSPDGEPAAEESAAPMAAPVPAEPVTIKVDMSGAGRAVFNAVAAGSPPPAPEPEPAPVAFDPSAFRNAMERAADPMPDYDPGHLRSLMAAVRDDAPAAPEPARPDAPYVPPPVPEAPAPAPEPVTSPGFDAARFRDLMTGVAHDAPAPAAPARPEPAYVPPPTTEAPPPPPPLDAHTLITDYFRAAMNAAANDAPAPPTQAAPEREPPDPIPAIDRTLFERSLREARL